MRRTLLIAAAYLATAFILLGVWRAASAGPLLVPDAVAVQPASAGR